MRIALSTAFLFVLVAGPATAQIEGGLSGPALSRGIEVLESVAAAHGGRDELLALTSLSIEFAGEAHDLSQSYRPAHSLPGEQFALRVHMDIANQLIRVERELEQAGGFDFHWNVIRNGESDYFSMPLMGHYAPLPTANPEGSWRLAQAWVPPVIVRHALENANQVRHVGETREDRRRFDVLSMPWGNSTAYLYIDRRTQLMAAFETSEFSTNLGNFIRRIEFDGYTSGAGLALPSNATSYDGSDEPFYVFELVESEINETYPDGFFSRGEELVTFVEGGAHVEEIAPHVYMIYDLNAGLLYHTLAVEMEEGIFLVDAPISGGMTRAALGLLAEAVPGKQVTQASFTHHHSDHISGVRHLVSEGVPLLVTQDTDGYLRSFFDAPYVTVKDALALEPVDPVIEIIDGVTTYTDGITTIEAHPVETPHAAQMIVYYIPEHDILFHADLYTTISPVGASEVFLLDLIEAFADEERPIEIVLGSHHPQMTPDELRSIVAEAGLIDPT